MELQSCVFGWSLFDEQVAASSNDDGDDSGE